jgi:nucleotide-binding universal stress UspA family protein
MFERILVALDGSVDSHRAAELAIFLARRFESRLTALFVIDTRFIEGPAIEALAPIWGEVGIGSFRGEVLKAWRERSAAELDRFVERASAAGLGSVERREAAGLPEESIVEAGRSADLVVIGRRGENAGFGLHPIGSTLARVLRQASHPVLVPGRAPDGQQRLTSISAAVPSIVPPEILLVALDDHAPSMRALDLAIRFGTAVGAEIRLLTAGEEEADERLAPAHRLCNDHGIAWESVRLDAEPDEAVAEGIERWDADWLFMGAYGHGRIHDLVLGSRTESILAKVPVPAFVVR